MTTKICKRCSKEVNSWINIDSESHCIECFKVSIKKDIKDGYNPAKEFAKASNNLKKWSK